MGINLQKLAEDLGHKDEDIRLLAMRTLCRVDLASTTMSNLGLLQQIERDLKRAIEVETGDTLDHARRAYEHLLPNFGPGPAAATAAPTGARPQAGPRGSAAAVTSPLPPPSPLRTKDPAELAKVLTTLVTRPDPDQHAPLLELLPTLEGRLLAVALQALGSVGSETDLPILQTHFGSAAPEVRAFAVQAYARLAPPAAILPALGPVLTDPDPRVLLFVLQALARADREAVFRHLEVLLQSPLPGSRAAAIQALGGITGDNSVALLRRASRDEIPVLRLRVVQALEYHAHPQIPDILARLAGDSDGSVAAAAAASLRRRGAAPAPASAPVAEPGAPARQAPRLRPSPAALDSGDYPRKVFRLQEIEQKELREARHEVLEACSGTPDSLTLASALSALRVVGTREDLEEAQRFLVHRNDRVRANAVETVERLGTREDILSQLAPMANDRDNRVRGNVLKALAPIEPESVLPHVEVLLVSPDEETRATALYVIGALDGPAVEPLLTRAIADPAVSLRRKTVPLLAKLHQPWCREALERLAEDADGFVRAQATRELASWEGLAATPPAPAAPEQAPRPPSPPALDRPAPAPPALERPAQAETPPAVPAAPSASETGPADEAPRPKAKTGERRSRATRAAAAPDLPPLKPSGSRSIAPGQLFAPTAPAKEPPTGAIDFKEFDPSSDASAAGSAPGSAMGREMDPDSRDSAPSRLMLTPELQGQLDALYDQLDEQLELIGRRICKAIRSNLVTEIDLISQASPVKKYEAQLEAHNEETARMGLLKALFSNREMESKKAQLVFQLSEAYRKVGECAVEKAQTSGKRHADLQELYKKVDELFLAVRRLKEGKS